MRDLMAPYGEKKPRRGTGQLGRWCPFARGESPPHHRVRAGRRPAYTFWTFPDRIQRVHTFTCRFFPWSRMRSR